MKVENKSYEREHVLWALGSLCALHQKSFAGDLLAREMPVVDGGGIEPGVIVQMGERLGFRVKPVEFSKRSLPKLHFPLLVELRQAESAAHSLGLVTAVN